MTMTYSKVRVCVRGYLLWNFDPKYLSLEIGVQGSSRNRAKVLRLLSDDMECSNIKEYETPFSEYEAAFSCTASKCTQPECDDLESSDSEVHLTA